MAGSRPTHAAPAARLVSDGLRALTHSSTGRVLLASLIVKALSHVAGLVLPRRPALFVALDTVSSFVLVGVVGYIVLGALKVAPRRLLWRVRRKLILSYVFVGVVPAALIVTFFLVGGLLLCAYIGSYLLHVELNQTREQAMIVARETARELQGPGARDLGATLARRQGELSTVSPDASIAVVPSAGGCAPGRGAVGGRGEYEAATAGPWRHADPPRTIPDWIGCEGAADFYVSPVGATERARRDGRRGPHVSVQFGDDSTPDRSVHLLVRAVAWTQGPGPGAAVAVDVPIGGPVVARVLDRASVQLMTVSTVGSGHVLPSAPARVADPLPPMPGSDIPVDSVSFFEYRDWTTGARATLYATLRLRVLGLYSRISAAQGSIEGRSIGQGFLIALLVVGVLFLLIQFAAVAMGLALARSITGSIHELFTGTARVRQGDFAHRITVTAHDQLGDLAQSFNQMTASVEQSLREAGEKKRLEEELRIAHDIQMSLLPRDPVCIPGVSLTALCVPAREVGGDYYDFLPLDDGRLGLLIADVAGKGTSAALYMAELKGLVLSLSRTCESPRELLVTANRLIAQHLAPSSFITMTYAVLDVRARTMTYARAGHTPLLYVPGRSDGTRRRAQVLAPDGLVLGLNLDEGELFERLLEERTHPLSNGDLFVFYTDGITEAMNGADDCFGEQRLATLVEAHADLPSHALRDRLIDDVARFVDGAPQHDDMTMLIVKIGELAAVEAAPRVEDLTARV